MFRKTDAPDFDPRLPPSAFRRPRAAHGSPFRGQHGLGALVPLLILVTVVVVELVSGPQVRVLYWLALVPWASVPLCGTWETAGFAVVTVIVSQVVARPEPKTYQDDLQLSLLLAVGSAIAVLVSWTRTRREERVLRMRDIAETTRRVVLRPLPEGLGGLDHRAVYLPANNEARIGGDFYDIQPSPWGTRVLIGDVQGKGLEAVEAAAALLGTFREAGYHEQSLATVASRMEIRLQRQIAYRLDLGVEEDRDRFATAVIVAFPEEEPDIVEMANFGHDAPLLVRPDGTVRRMPSAHGLPLGMSQIADLPPPLLRIPVEPGSTVLLTTDGVTEVRDKDGVFFPLLQEVSRAVADDPDMRSPQALAGLVRDTVLRHSGGRLDDDTTIFAVRRQGAGTGRPADRPPSEETAEPTSPGERENSFFRLGLVHPPQIKAWKRPDGKDGD